MLLFVVGLVGLVGLTAALVVAGYVGRWLVVRALGVRGVPFPFGAGAKWCWAGASVLPQALGFGGSVLGMYVVSGAMIALGTQSTGFDVPDDASMRVHVEPGGPADAAGVRDGDRVASVDGAPVTSWDAFRSAIARHAGESVDLTVTRYGDDVHIAVTPDASGHIRVRMPVVHREAGLGESLREAAVGPARFLTENVRAIARVVMGSEHGEVTGPVGIVRETGRQAGLGPGRLVVFLGFLGAYLLPFVAISALFTGPGRRRTLRARPR